jgi:hypothetical protein
MRYYLAFIQGWECRKKHYSALVNPHAKNSLERDLFDVGYLIRRLIFG